MRGCILKNKSADIYVMELDMDMDVVTGVAYVSCIERAMFIDVEEKEAVEEEFKEAIDDLGLKVIEVERLTKEIL